MLCSSANIDLLRGCVLVPSTALLDRTQHELDKLHGVLAGVLLRRHLPGVAAV
eukprot:COSAG01_NODE_34843_length_541_cov_0.782805_1_plen_52_part_01